MTTPIDKLKRKQDAKKRSVANLLALKANPDAEMVYALKGAKHAKEKRRSKNT